MCSGPEKTQRPEGKTCKCTDACLVEEKQKRKAAEAGVEFVMPDVPRLK